METSGETELTEPEPLVRQHRARSARESRGGSVRSVPAGQDWGKSDPARVARERKGEEVRGVRGREKGAETKSQASQTRPGEPSLERVAKRAKAKGDKAAASSGTTSKPSWTQI